MCIRDRFIPEPAVVPQFVADPSLSIFGTSVEPMAFAPGGGPPQPRPLQGEATDGSAEAI